MLNHINTYYVFHKNSLDGINVVVLDFFVLCCSEGSCGQAAQSQWSYVSGSWTTTNIRPRESPCRVAQESPAWFESKTRWAGATCQHIIAIYHVLYTLDQQQNTWHKKGLGKSYFKLLNNSDVTGCAEATNCVSGNRGGVPDDIWSLAARLYHVTASGSS